MKRQLAYFFGYGSLVNRMTHDFDGAATAMLDGWRRVWRHTTERQVAYLTITPAPGSHIDGLIAPVPAQDWAALDHRERAYARLPATHQIRHALPTAPQIAVYAIPDGQHQPPSPDHMLLLSYIDVVVQGYLREFGEAGVDRFFATTDGWDSPILDDRDTPRYPRHCVLSRHETDCVNRHLADIRASFLRA